MEIFIFFIIGMIAGWALGSVFLGNKIGKLLARLGITPEQLQAAIDADDNVKSAEPAAPASDEIKINVECENGQLFAYRTSDHKFLAQDTSYSALLKKVWARVGERKLCVTMDDDYKSMMP